MYKKKKDHQTGEWMVHYHDGKGGTTYIMSFQTPHEAQEYCNAQNALLAQMQARTQGGVG